MFYNSRLLFLIRICFRFKLNVRSTFFRHFIIIFLKNYSKILLHSIEKGNNLWGPKCKIFHALKNMDFSAYYYFVITCKWKLGMRKIFYSPLPSPTPINLFNSSIKGNAILFLLFATQFKEQWINRQMLFACRKLIAGKKNFYWKSIVFLLKWLYINLFWDLVTNKATKTQFYIHINNIE